MLGYKNEGRMRLGGSRMVEVDMAGSSRDSHALVVHALTLGLTSKCAALHPLCTERIDFEFYFTAGHTALRA